MSRPIPLAYDAKDNWTDDRGYAYDNENRVIQVCRIATPCTVLLSVEYDALGRVISRTVDGEQPVRYVYDGLSYGHQSHRQGNCSVSCRVGSVRYESRTRK